LHIRIRAFNVKGSELAQGGQVIVPTGNDFRQKELDCAIELARAAGQILLAFYAQKPELESKAGGEPVTVADCAVNDFLVNELRRRFPKDGILSEEGPDDASRRDRRRVWIVDPLDGTREFAEHRNEFSVMIGLAVESFPAIGVVYDPGSDQLYYAAAGSGAFLVNKCGSVTQLRVSREADPRKMTVALSRSHHSPEADQICRRLGIGQSLYSGSLGLKIGMICEGSAHMCLYTTSHVAQWDTCAPDALLREAGGRMTDLRGAPLCYNGPELRHRNGVIASNGTIHDRIVEAASHV